MYQQIYVQEKSKIPTSKLDMGSRLFEDGIIYLFGEVNDELAYVVVQQLQYLSAKNPEKDITLIINSPGGSVSSGLAIYDVMQAIPNDVMTVCIGMAASMGAFLFAGGTAGKRVIYPNAEVMIHQPLGGVQGQATDINITAEHINRTKERLNKYLAKHTGKSLTKVQNDTERDNWMTAQEAVEYGIADKIQKGN